MQCLYLSHGACLAQAASAGAGGAKGLQSLADEAGLSLGPISLSFADGQQRQRPAPPPPPQQQQQHTGGGVPLCPISISFGGDAGGDGHERPEPLRADSGAEAGPGPRSIHSMTTAEWRARYERDGMVDLWVEEEFNAGSRLVVRKFLLPSRHASALDVSQ